MKYKGYTAKVELDEEQGVLFGRVLGLRDVITFEARTVPEAIEEFQETIDFYLETCAKRGEEPDRPYSGNFMVRIDPARHRALAIAAEEEGKSLNAMVDDLVETFLLGAGHGKPVTSMTQGVDVEDSEGLGPSRPRARGRRRAK